MNNYARLPHVRNELNAQSSDAQDDDILRAIERASAAARTATSRNFHTTVATKVFDGNGGVSLWVDDLIEVTSLKFDTDGDGVYETTVTGFSYWPRNETPYRRIDLGLNASESVFPARWESVQIVGKFGYSETLEAVEVSSTAVTGTLSSTSDLTLTASVSVEGVIEPGDSVYIEDEQLQVTAVATTTVTVVRGINGTTAASHTDKALYLRRFPADLERAVSADAARYLWRASQGYAEDSFRQMWPAIHDTLSSHQNPAAVI